MITNYIKIHLWQLALRHHSNINTIPNQSLMNNYLKGDDWPYQDIYKYYSISIKDLLL